MLIQEHELKQETMAMSACYVPVFLKKKHNNAHKAVWFTKATVIGAISAFVDSIDSHIILQMIRESKGDLYAIHCNTTQYGSQSIHYSGVRIWNLLPVDIGESYDLFSHKLKDFFCHL